MPLNPSIIKPSVASLLVALGVAAPAHGLTINATYDSTITNDANAANIEADIQAAIDAYQSNFADNVTVAIKFQEGGGLGSSSTYITSTSYSGIRTQLANNAKSSDALTALGTLPIQTNNPVNSTASLRMTTAQARALGYNSNPPGTDPYDSTITLNTSLCYNGTTPASGKYQLQSVVMHEMDEVLGSSSALGAGFNVATGTPSVTDLFRYTNAGNGTRSFDLNTGTSSWLSLDGARNLVQYNQHNDGSDYGDYVSGDNPARVQDAYGTPAANNADTSGNHTLGVEKRLLNAIGWHRVMDTLTWSSTISYSTTAQGTSTAAAVDGSGTWTNSATAPTAANVATFFHDATDPSDKFYQGWNPSDVYTTTAVFGNGGAAGTVTVSGGVSVNNLAFNAVTGHYVIAGSTITLNGTSYGPGGGAITPTITTNNDAEIDSVLAGTAGFTKAGTSTLTLGGTNTYSGTTTVSAGTLQIGNGGATGTLGSGNVVNNGTLAFNRSDTPGYGVSNAISGSGALKQTGSGTTTLTGANTYSGATSVSAGTLLVNGTHAAGAGTYTVSGGTLGGNGTITTTGNFTVQSGGTIIAGTDTSANGHLTVAGLGARHLNGTYKFDVDFGATTGTGDDLGDLLDVTGATSVDISGLVFDAETESNLIHAGSAYAIKIFQSNVAATGAFTVNNLQAGQTVSSTDGGLTYYLRYSLVPEPASFAMLGLGSLLLLRRGRRRRA